MRRPPRHRPAPRRPRRQPRTPRRPCWRPRSARPGRRRPARAASAGMSTSPRLECRSSRPCASLVILATPPAMVTRGTGCARRYFSRPPAKSPISSSATSGKPCSACTAASDVLPVEPATCPTAHRPRHVDAAMDGVDPGRAGIRHHDSRGAQDGQPADDAQPAVQRALGQLFAARDGDFHDRVRRAPISARALRIMARGTGLMAGSPGGIGRPGRVTVPTPGPARNTTPLPGAPVAHAPPPARRASRPDRPRRP